MWPFGSKPALFEEEGGAVDPQRQEQLQEAVQSAQDYSDGLQWVKRLKILETEVPSVVKLILQACADEPFFKRYHALVVAHLCSAGANPQRFRLVFEEAFSHVYLGARRLQPGQLCNLAALYGHVLAAGALSYDVLCVVQLEERDANPSQKLLLRQLFQDLYAIVGPFALRQRVGGARFAPWLSGLLPRGPVEKLQEWVTFYERCGLRWLAEAAQRRLEAVVADGLAAGWQFGASPRADGAMKRGRVNDLMRPPRPAAPSRLEAAAAADGLAAGWQ